MTKPLCIDLFCGMFGWSRPWLDLGGYVVGIDICHEPYHGPVPKGADLVLQDVRTLDGAQFKDASLILASSPCPEYSYMAMPWRRAKQIGRALRGQDVFPEGYRGSQSIEELNDLFYQPQRIQREASEAAGRYIPLVQENVRGAEPWVGRAAFRYGSFYLWGDVPALMPLAERVTKLSGGASWYPPSDPRHQPGLDFTRLAGQKANPDGTDHGSGSWFAVADSKNRGSKNTGGSWFNIGLPGQKVTNNNPARGDGEKGGDRNAHRASGGTLKSARFTNPEELPTFGQDVGDGVKGGGDWFSDPSSPSSPSRQSGSRSPARKAASARIAKIPAPLASHIARVYYPRREAVA